MAMKKAAPKKKKSEYGSYGTNDVSGMGVAGRGTKAGEAPYTSYGRTTKRGMDQAKRKAAKPIKAQSARMTALAKASKKKK
jgi:hypothetical protein